MKTPPFDVADLLVESTKNLNSVKAVLVELLSKMDEV